MRPLPLSAGAAWLFALGYGVTTLYAVANDAFTATWNPPTDPRAVYEFRWRHFANGNWQALPEQEGRALSFVHRYPALPNEPTTDRWLCLDARSRVGDLVSQWLSETSDGAACSTEELGAIAVPAPPPVELPPPPMPPPDVFTDIEQADGRLSFSYQIAACPRGVQQTTSAAVNGRKTITLRCRR